MKLDNYFCDGQMDIFDFLGGNTTTFKNAIIDELHNDLMDLIPEVKERQEKAKYSVWEHVPNLGKRYEIFIDIKSYPSEKSLNDLVKKYKEKSLEVSICHCPSMKDDYVCRWLISTMWTTKGHKEIL